MLNHSPWPSTLSADLPSTGGSLSVAAGGKKAEATASALADADADLEERLKNLRRDWTLHLDSMPRIFILSPL